MVATMVTKDNPVQVAQAALGHRNIQTTLRYIDPTEPARAALDRLGESLRKAGELNDARSLQDGTPQSPH